MFCHQFESNSLYYFFQRNRNLIKSICLTCFVMSINNQSIDFRIKFIRYKIIYEILKRNVVKTKRNQKERKFENFLNNIKEAKSLSY